MSLKTNKYFFWLRSKAKKLYQTTPVIINKFECQRFSCVALSATCSNYLHMTPLTLWVTCACVAAVAAATNERLKRM